MVSFVLRDGFGDVSGQGFQNVYVVWISISLFWKSPSLERPEKLQIF